MAVQISGNDITVPRDGSFTRNVTIGGTLTYEDVTNIDSVGLVTARTGIEIGARPGVAASISVDGNMIVSGISTFGGAINGTLATAAQANVTSVGTLTGLTVSADATVNGVTVGKGANSVAGNTVLGESALDASVSGGNNTAIGLDALSDLTSGARNTSIGADAGENITTGNDNVSVGMGSLMIY